MLIISIVKGRDRCGHNHDEMATKKTQGMLSNSNITLRSYSVCRGAREVSLSDSKTDQDVEQDNWQQIRWMGEETRCDRVCLCASKIKSASFHAK
jgi:hypothetical protein